MAFDRPVRFGTLGQSFDYAPFYVDQAKKYFENLFQRSVVHITYDCGKNLNQAILNGDVDIIFERLQALLIQRDQNIPVRMIAPLAFAKQRGIIVHPDSRIKTLADLIDRKVGVTRGTGCYFGLAHNLSENGISLEQVAVVDLPEAKAMQAFLKKDVDALSLADPWPDILLNKKQAVHLPKSDFHALSVIAVRQGFAVERPRPFELFCKNYHHLIETTLENEEDSIKILSKALHLPQDVIDSLWPHYEFVSAFSDPLWFYVEDVTDLFSKIGLIRPNPDIVKTLQKSLL